MRKLTTVLAVLFVTLMTVSCNNKQSLQGYLVESQGKQGFMTFDIPVNFFKPKSDDVPAEVLETIQSIHKINVVALPYKNNEAEYDAEKAKINEILKSSDKYKSLMRMNAKGIKMNLYYTGSTDAIDEVIAFGYQKELGVGVARIMGEDMNPSQIIKMMENITWDSNGMNLKQFNMAFQ